MAEPTHFSPAKLVCGIITGEDPVFQNTEERLSRLFGVVDAESLCFPFDITDYYKWAGR